METVTTTTNPRELYNLFKMYRGRKVLLGTGSLFTVQRELEKRKVLNRTPGVSFSYTKAKVKVIR